MKSLTTLAARHREQMKSRENLGAKSNAALHKRIANKVLTPVKYHVTEYVNGVKTKKTVTKEKYRTSQVALTLKARSRAAHQIESEVARDKRR